MTTKAVRGAVQLDADTPEEMRQRIGELLRQLMERNVLAEHDLISIQFTQTQDLISANPASCLRYFGYAEVPLFCSQEPRYHGSLPRVVRTLVTFRSSTPAPGRPVYLNGAENLRTDIAR